MSDPNLEPGHVFDQTNGVIEDLDGDSDGTATSDTSSAAERDVASDDGDRQPRAEDDAARSDAVPDPSAADGRTGEDDGAARAGRVDDDTAAGTPSSSTVDPAHDGDAAGADYAPTADLPLPGERGDDADQGTEHVYAVERDGTATDEGEAGSSSPTPAGADQGGTTATYSDAPAVAERSAADDGRDEMSDRDHAEGRSDGGRPVAYAAGTEEARAASADEPTSPGASEDAGRSTPSGVADLSGGDIGHVFDQTNGVIEGLEGESDGTAEGDDESRADRVGENEPNPVGQQDAWKDDHYGEAAGTDRNP